MTQAEIDAIDDAIHDRWFSVEDIEYDPTTRIWSVPFFVDSGMRPPKLRSLKGASGTRILEIRGVTSFELVDTEKIVWYMFNVLKHRPVEGIIDVVSCFPLGLTLYVSSPEVRILDQE